MPAPSLATVLELLKPITWFPPMWAFGCGVVSSGLPNGYRWPCCRGGHPACRSDGLRHQAGGERLVRPARRRDQRAESPDPVRTHARPMGLLHRGRLDRAVAAGGDGARSLGLRGRRARAGARLGLQRAAVPAEAQRLVGQCGGRTLLRGPALVHRRGRHGGRDAGLARDRAGRCSTASARTAS